MRVRSIVIVMAAALVVPSCSGAPHRPADPPPAVGAPVALDARVPGWETSAWLASDVFCVRAARPVEEREAGQENEATFCDPLPSALTISGPPLLPAKPLPYLFPSDPRTKEILLVGTVRGAVTSVSVTMFGQTTAADVHPLPATGDRRVGAYAVWLPRSGQERAGMNLADITAVVGYDASGSVVTRLA